MPLGCQCIREELSNLTVGLSMWSLFSHPVNSSAISKHFCKCLESAHLRQSMDSLALPYDLWEIKGQSLSMLNVAKMSSAFAWHIFNLFWKFLWNPFLTFQVISFTDKTHKCQLSREVLSGSNKCSYLKTALLSRPRLQKKCLSVVIVTKRVHVFKVDVLKSLQCWILAW